MQNVTLNGHNASNMPRGECLAMRGALVAIGTRSGAVYIYHIDGKWKNQVKGCNILCNKLKYMLLLSFKVNSLVV